MAELKEARVPDIGDYDGVPVIELLVAVGDTVQQDQGLVTLESDKATMEVPAPFAGIVRELKVKIGDNLAEGSVVALIEPSEGAVAAPAAAAAPKAAAPAAPPAPNHPLWFLVYLIAVTALSLAVGRDRPIVRLLAWLAVAVPFAVWSQRYGATGWYAPALIAAAAIYVLHLFYQLQASASNAAHGDAGPHPALHR